MKTHLKYGEDYGSFMPIITTETGYYMGTFTFFGPGWKKAESFKALQYQIDMGNVEKIPYRDNN